MNKNEVRDSLRKLARNWKAVAEKAAAETSDAQKTEELLAAAAVFDENEGSIASLITIISDYDELIMWRTGLWQRSPPEEWKNLGPFIPGGLTHVSGLIWAVLTIVDKTDTDTRQLQAQLFAARRLQTTPATLATTSNSQRLEQSIRRHGDPAHQRHPEWSAEDVAREILPLVNNDCGADRKAGRYSQSTVEKRLRKRWKTSGGS
jgi:hypothetical protein